MVAAFLPPARRPEVVSLRLPLDREISTSPSPCKHSNGATEAEQWVRSLIRLETKTPGARTPGVRNYLRLAAIYRPPT